MSKDGLRSIEVCGTPVAVTINAVETNRLFNVGYEEEVIPDSYFENRVVRISESAANGVTLTLPIRDVASVDYGDWSTLQIALQPTSTDVTEGLPYEISGVSVPVYGVITYSESNAQGSLILSDRVASMVYKQGNRYDFGITLLYDGEGGYPVSVFSSIVFPD